MSELKAHEFCECDECIREYRRPLSNEMRLYYLKSEADEVIAAKVKELRHHKYKRCLAIALLWLERAEDSTDLENELVSRRRCSKWMELAEKFKEAK